MASVFTPPTWTYNEPHPGSRPARLFDRMKWCQVGYSIIRDAAGGYTQVAYADDDDAKFSTAFYMGGRAYTLSAQEVIDLTAAGYGSYIKTV